jgi:hypothetical protein
MTVKTKLAKKTVEDYGSSNFNWIVYDSWQFSVILSSVWV